LGSLRYRVVIEVGHREEGAWRGLQTWVAEWWRRQAHPLTADEARAARFARAKAARICAAEVVRRLHTVNGGDEVRAAIVDGRRRVEISNIVTPGAAGAERICFVPN